MDAMLRLTNAYDVQDCYWVKFQDGVQTWSELLECKFKGLSFHDKGIAQKLADAEKLYKFYNLGEVRTVSVF